MSESTQKILDHAVTRAAQAFITLVVIPVALLVGAYTLSRVDYHGQELARIEERVKSIQADISTGRLNRYTTDDAARDALNLNNLITGVDRRQDDLRTRVQRLEDSRARQ